MRHYLALLLALIVLPVFAQEDKPTVKAAAKEDIAPVFAPWKAPKHKTYHDKNALAWKRAGFAFSDFVGVEGQRYAFNNQDHLRYSHSDSPGYVQKGQHAMNFLGVGKLPISDAFAFFAKAGPSYYQPIDQEASSDLLPANQNMHEWGVSYSTGASLNLTETLQLSLEYGHTEVDQMEMEGSTAQLSWSFK